jgi:hypothetical protein
MNDSNETVDIAPLLEELTKNNNKLSYYCYNLLKKINDLYVRLEINAEVIEACVLKLGMKEEDFAELVKTCIYSLKRNLNVNELEEPIDGTGEITTSSSPVTETNNPE